MMKRHALAFLVAAAVLPAAHAGVVDNAQHAAQQQAWSAWGGEIGIRWNADILDNLGIHPGQQTGQLNETDFHRHEWFQLRQSGGLQFKVFNSALQNFTGGSLQMRGGYVLQLRDGSSIDMRDMSLRVREKDTKVLDIVSGDGKVWFYTDRVMFELANGNQMLAIRAADIRIGPDLANRLGVPEANGWEIGDMAMNTQVNIQGSNNVPDRVCSPYPWPNVAVPNVPDQTYKGDLFMQSFSVDPVGCMHSNGSSGCDGPGGDDGIAGFAPTSSLINNKNDGTFVPTVPNDPLGTSTSLYTANIAWYTMFTGSPPNYNPPYKNDQHPFLIWNLYRINSDGTIDQIGRSGVKHAFLTINAGCMDSCNDPHSLGLGCGDTYGSGNNDDPGAMGPRSEIVPAEGTWGRCGSIWDPSCNGQEHSDGNNSWTQRMQVHESQLDPAVNTGATYKFESWYIARDDINILNSMATLSVTPHFGGGTWSLNNQSAYRLGPAIDRWVDPVHPAPNSSNSPITSSEGHAKVAVKVTDNGNGTWTYYYAVMNLDFARAIEQTPAAGPDPRVLSNAGFDSFTVPIPAGATVSTTGFRNGTVDGSGAWTASTGANSVTWSASGQPTLNWGTMYSFSLTVNASPRSGTPTAIPKVSGLVSLHVANTGAPASYNATAIVPQIVP
ncbi:MAG TPA: hypothetical protein VGO25_11880 [Rhodanobacteraceae bacterium]|nr:hypothetical protein [Rhodanobacteraceae bacterium]